MNKLSIPRFGFAVAVACAVSYLGCVFVMMTVPQDVAIRFFNSLMHGVDVTTIMRWDMPLWENGSRRHRDFRSRLAIRCLDCRVLQLLR